MQTQQARVKAAIRDLQLGKMVLLTDDPGRENEGDLIVAAEKVSPENMNFMIRHGTGIVCLAMAQAQLSKIGLPLMVPPHANTCARGTQFTVSIDAKENTTTGVSAADRANTILTAMRTDVTLHDFVVPGHVFPLLAKNGGVFERQGHTEGSVDLARLAGCAPAAVLCEIMNEDGTMAKGDDLISFANKHNIVMLSIDDILTYRLQTENMIESESSALLPLDPYGEFTIRIIKEKWSTTEHIVLSKAPVNNDKPLLVRVHSSCVTGDLFASQRCDCNKQLHHALQRISEEGGMLIYLNQEGRGIGLFDKIRAYALQEKGYDTVEANEQLGLPIDSRKYYMAASILRAANINHIRLLTNNPNKPADLEKYGITQIALESMPAFRHKHNEFYLQTKQQKLNHTIPFAALLKEAR